MPKFSKKVMGKEVGDAKVYAEPHTMDGKPLKIKDTTGAQEMAKMNFLVHFYFRYQHRPNMA